jgi:hypothetical protein
MVIQNLPFLSYLIPYAITLSPTVIAIPPNFAIFCMTIA